MPSSARELVAVLPCAGGDSGAPVFEIINDGVTPNEVALYGILWGGENGEYVFSRVKFIEDEL